MKIYNKFWLAFFVVAFFTSCANEPTASTETETPVSEETEGIEIDIENAENLEDALNQLSDAFKGFGKEDGEEVEIVNFRVLKDRLPDNIGGAARENAEGQTTGFAGFKISTANATYKTDDKKIEVNITDTGGLGSAMMNIADWSKLEIDKESDEGYERTTTINGNKAFQKYNNKTGSSELAVLIDERFLVALNGKNVEMSALEAALDDMDLEGLGE